MEKPNENTGSSTSTGGLGKLVQKPIVQSRTVWVIIAFIEFGIILTLLMK